LGNRGKVMVNKNYAPIVGAIGMNITTIDVTDIPDINLGQEVILIGDHDGVRASDLATIMKVNVRQITTGISTHIARILS